jgi:hypothetical protein
MARLKAISREIDALVKRELSRAAQQKLIADVARKAIREADENNRRVAGTTLPKEVFVDGKRDAPLESVNPNGGLILAQWQMIHEVVDYVWQLLVENSPVGSGPYSDGHTPGRYQRSHTLFADRIELDKPDPNLVAKEWVFMSSVPYARKIERGQSDPAAVYETSAAMANARYGNVASIRFTFLDWIGGRSMFTDWLSGKDYSGLGEAAGRRQFLKNSRQPTIIITPK